MDERDGVLLREFVRLLEEISSFSDHANIHTNIQFIVACTLMHTQNTHTHTKNELHYQLLATTYVYIHFH